MLLYITEGEGNHTIDFQSFPIAPHTLAIVSKHQVNQFGAQSVLEGFLVLITEEFLQRALFDLEGTVTSLLFEPITTQALFFKRGQIRLSRTSNGLMRSIGAATTMHNTPPS